MLKLIQENNDIKLFALGNKIPGFFLELILFKEYNHKCILYNERNTFISNYRYEL